MSGRILIVDDNPLNVKLLAARLTREYYAVTTAHNGKEALALAQQEPPDLILLDVMMPEMNGWQMLQRLREFSNVPVIMLTAVDGVDNKVLGLDYGADDYITKPFEVRELKARIRSALRRATTPVSESSDLLSFDGNRLVIDPPSRKVTLDGEEVSLTPTEYKLLLYLACNAGRVLTYDQILDNVWGPGYEDSPNNVKVYVRRLRQKLEDDPRDPRYVLTQWGIGYSLAKI